MQKTPEKITHVRDPIDFPDVPLSVALANSNLSLQERLWALEAINERRALRAKLEQLKDDNERLRGTKTNTIGGKMNDCTNCVLRDVSEGSPLTPIFWMPENFGPDEWPDEPRHDILEAAKLLLEDDGDEGWEAWHDLRKNGSTRITLNGFIETKEDPGEDHGMDGYEPGMIWYSGRRSYAWVSGRCLR